MNKYNVTRQMDGWPVGMSDEDKRATVQIVRETMQNAARSLTTDEIHTHTKEKLKKLPSWHGAALLDWRYASIERALNEIAYTVWVLKSEFL